MLSTKMSSAALKIVQNAVQKKAGCMLRIRSFKFGNALYYNFSSSSAVHKSFIIENHDDFVKRVMNSDVPVVVNFHAEWCDPCKILSPKLKELVEPRTDIDLAIIDVENNADLVHTFEVKAVPAVLAVNNGMVVDKFIGLVDADMIENLISKLTRKKDNQV